MKDESQEPTVFELLQSNRKLFLVSEEGHAVAVQIHQIEQNVSAQPLNIFGSYMAAQMGHSQLEIRAKVYPQVFESRSAIGRDGAQARVKELEAENSLLRESLRLLGIGESK